jgi:hypothetical protein
MLKSYDVGYDPGNSEPSAVVIMPDDEQRVITIPSYVGRGKSDNLNRFRNMRSSLAFDALRHGEYILYCSEVGNSECYVGELALSQGHVSTSAFGDSNRYRNPHSLQLLLTAAGALNPNTESEIHVVTGTPIETFSDRVLPLDMVDNSTSLCERMSSGFSLHSV